MIIKDNMANMCAKETSTYMEFTLAFGPKPEFSFSFKLPVMNGLDAAKAIRGLSRPDAPTVPIIALSANAFAEDIQKSKNAGINEHLAKPLEMDKVLKVIASYCK